MRCGLEVRQRRLHRAVQPVGVDALHELVALGRRGLDRGPPDGARVVDEGVEAGVVLPGPGGVS